MQVEDILEYNLQSNKLQSFEENDCPSELKDDIKQIIKSEGFIKSNVKINELPADGGNFLAELYEIDIAGLTAKGQSEINIFAKQINLGSGSFNAIMDIPGLYKIERFAYKELFRVFNELQEDFKVPVDERYKTVKCYDSNPGAILMDNLCKQGYKTNSRIDTISIDFAEKAIKNIAKFHGLSFAIEKIKPDFFDSKIKPLKYPINFTTEWREYQKSMLSVSMSNLEHDLRNRVEGIILSKLNKFCEYYKNVEVSCLCHGDYRVMNMMVRDLDNKIMDFIALDYQLIHYGNPIMDLFYFIFPATGRKFRKTHLSYLKETYYKTLKNFLKYFDIDIEEIFPRSNFERVYEETLDYGLLTMTTIAPLTYADTEDVPDLVNVSMVDLNFKVLEVFKDRVKGVVEDFIEWGYL
ncbi:hypothetical protein K1T71_005899 [Dendrolimus kikuchii]|uniref:Uncharacterized protein n=1 Tax=Dendrolimus kikuchii TaxID=765133 RepID=A0ACC1D2K2_9NEOP|nr:hypothetical protein K1T71_005899 [Dendrolimus kikuchii]